MAPPEGQVLAGGCGELAPAGRSWGASAEATDDEVVVWGRLGRWLEDRLSERQVRLGTAAMSKERKSGDGIEQRVTSHTMVGPRQASIDTRMRSPLSYAV
jgi:hypothetical protein